MSKTDWFSRLLHGFAELFDTSNESALNINYLPDELLLEIFSYVELKDLLTVRRVCERWRSVGADHTLWRQLSLEFEPGKPGAHPSKRSRMLRLAPCVQHLKLVLPSGRHLSFQSRELQLVPPVVRQLSVQFVPSTLALVLQVLERALPSMRRLELTAQDELSYFPQHGGGAQMPEEQVRRVWELLGGSRVEDLSIRGCCGELLEKWNTSGLAVPGPCQPQLERLEVSVLTNSKLPTRREELGVSHDISHTITMMLRAHAATLRRVTVDVRFEEPHNDLIMAPMLCPALLDLTMSTNVFKLCSKILEGGVLDIEGCSWDKDLLVSFLGLAFVRSRVQALTLTHIDLNMMYVWPPLTQWDRLRALDIRKCSCLDLQVPLANLISKLHSLENLRFWKVRHFKNGGQHLAEITPLVAPRLRILHVHLACWKECVCYAKSRIDRSFAGLDLNCYFSCNYH